MFFCDAYGFLSSQLSEIFIIIVNILQKDQPGNLRLFKRGLGMFVMYLLTEVNNLSAGLSQSAICSQRQLLGRNLFLGYFLCYALEALGMVSMALLGLLFSLRFGSYSSFGRDGFSRSIIVVFLAVCL